MSTFKGIVAEFPQIRIDYFRQHAEHQAPLACFLSHIHSDHLNGLEFMRAPFVYCSAATRGMLLRLEKRCHRINFAQGVLESRNVTYDTSIQKLAEPLPLDAPTMIELSPGNSIRVTLIDANHCIGAVMFLIEGDGKAILYTGDVRAEAWWINSIVQNPVLLPYTSVLRRLDCIYLDTTFTTKSKPYCESAGKAAGIQALLEKVDTYPPDTIFYFHSWTFGYEQVWVALSAFLNSRTHVDDYRAGIYGSLSTLTKKELRDIGLNTTNANKFLRESDLAVLEAPALCGFRNGNHLQPGCLTSAEAARIHSCERGAGCQVMDQDDAHGDVVHIIPIVNRHDGVEIAEQGAGGGKGDLDHGSRVEFNATADVQQFVELCVRSIADEQVLANVTVLLERMLSEGNRIIDLNVDSQTGGDPSFRDLVPALASTARKKQEFIPGNNKVIRFPYSRHSSYSELCQLVAAFQPKDVFPCTVSEDAWSPATSMQCLFGEFCSATVFRHDAEMLAMVNQRPADEEPDKHYHNTQSSSQEIENMKMIELVTRKRARSQDSVQEATVVKDGDGSCSRENPMFEGTKEMGIASRAVEVGEMATATIKDQGFFSANDIGKKEVMAEGEEAPDLLQLPLAPCERFTAEPAPSTAPWSGRKRSRSRLTNRELAYEAALGIRLSWDDFGGLESTRSTWNRREQEL